MKAAASLRTGPASLSKVVMKQQAAFAAVEEVANTLEFFLTRMCMSAPAPASDPGSDQNHDWARYTLNEPFELPAEALLTQFV